MEDIATEFPVIQPILTGGKFEPRLPFLSPSLTPDEPLMMRTGGCTVGCAACCQDIWLEVVVRDEFAEDIDSLTDWARWLQFHGVKLVKRPNAWFVVIPTPCQHLNLEDGSCNIHGTDEYPQMCKTFPLHYTQIQGLEHVCTYEFHPIG